MFLQLLSVGHLAVDTAASRGPTADYFGNRVLSLFVLQQLALHSGDSSCCGVWSPLPAVARRGKTLSPCTEALQGSCSAAE